MSHIVIGTAGHVDHGKTTLIKALTGIETDTTKEEKTRGMSINLGFAYLDLPNHKRVGIVDVPGHEKFIKNMVAGLPGINLVLLVIDAGEGVMQQTREHIDILTLLGIRNFLIVLTKIDTVDEEMKELAIVDIREQLAGTLLENAEIIETDALSGKGIPELLKKIEEWTDKIPENAETGSARMNIDRVFSVKGFGTVVTGTLLDGSVSVGDELTVYPSMKKVRVRNIQIHEQNVKRAESRQRTALNLANIGTDELTRGDVLCASDQLKPTWMIDVKVKCLDSAENPIGLWDRVRFLVGTKEVMARTVPIGSEAIAPGEEGFLQLRLEDEQVVVKERDRFILRSYSPMHTIAGGEVLDAVPQKHRRFKTAVLESLKTKEEGNLDDIIADFLINKKQSFTSLSELTEYTRAPKDVLAASLEQLTADNVIINTALGYIHQTAYKKLKGQGLQILLTYHNKFPLRPGITIEEFRSRLRKTLAEKEISMLLKLMLADGTCKEKDNYVAASNFEVVFNKYQLAAKEKIEAALKKSGYTPIKKDELLYLDKNAEEVLEALNGDTVIFLTFEYMISRDFYDQAIAKVHDYVLAHEQMTLGDFRDITDSSRKSSMLILEFLDKEGVTKRVDNYRILGPYWQKGE
jgi:selenocysteine-specific elongation factor